MLNEVEIAREICDLVKILIEKKTSDDDHKYAFGMLIGLLTALDKVDEFEESVSTKKESWLGFINHLLKDIADRNGMSRVSKDLN